MDTQKVLKEHNIKITKPRIRFSGFLVMRIRGLTLILFIRNAWRQRNWST